MIEYRRNHTAKAAARDRGSITLQTRGNSGPLAPFFRGALRITGVSVKSLLLILIFAPLLFAAADSAPKLVDVTQKIASAVRNGMLSMPVSSATLPEVDADPPKLRITYQVTNRVRTRAWAEGQTVEIAAPAGQALAITKAEYGAMDDAVDVTPVIRSLVKENAIPSTTVDDDSLHIDPSRGVTKQLVVRYEIAGKQKMMSVEESEALKIPAPSDGAKLAILEATYGLPVSYFDVTPIVADQVQGNSLAMTPSDELFGNPGSELAGKKLEITYMQAGQLETLSAKPGEALTITPKNSTPLIIVKATYGVVQN